MSKIVCKDLYKSYMSGKEENKVLKGVDFEIQEGELVILLGPSGSGKSTLLNILGGIEDFEKGDIVVDGIELKKLNSKELTKYRREKIGFVFQFYNLVPNLTIAENVESGAYLSKNPLNVDEIIKDLGITKQKDKFPRQVSGGQQQRASIGRAISKNPVILICDEPTGALDYNTSKEVLELLVEIVKKYHTTIIMATHNESFAKIANRVMRIHDGKIVENTYNENPKKVSEVEW